VGSCFISLCYYLIFLNEIFAKDVVLKFCQNWHIKIVSMIDHSRLVLYLGVHFFLTHGPCSQNEIFSLYPMFSYESFDCLKFVWVTFLRRIFQKLVSELKLFHFSCKHGFIVFANNIIGVTCFANIFCLKTQYVFVPCKRSLANKSLCDVIV